MKKIPSLKNIQIRMGLSVIAYDSLTQLEELAHSDQREAAEQLSQRIIQLMSDRNIELSVGNTAPVAHLYIEAEPAAEPAAVEPAPAAAEPAAVDYSTLIETAEKGVTDEVGTKV